MRWLSCLALLLTILSASPLLAQDALEEALRQAAPADSDEDLARTRIGPATLRLVDLSFIANMAFAKSSATRSQLQGLQGGFHDPRRNGFSLNGAELSVSGAVDPFFRLYMFTNFSDGAELEEAYAVSSALPYGLELKAGRFFTELGIINATHPHTWEWVDMPVIHSRLFGGHGMSGDGLRLAWLAPTPWFLEIAATIQNADGENMGSFMGESAGGGGHSHGGGEEEPMPIGGYDPVVDRRARGDETMAALRIANALEFGGGWTARLGLNLAGGPNATGPDGQTLIYGADFLLRWRPGTGRRGFPYLSWQSEVFRREYRVHKAVDAGQLEATWSLLKSGFPEQFENTEYFDSTTLSSLLGTTLLSPDRGDLGLLIDVLSGAQNFATLNGAEQQGVIEAGIRSAHPTETLHDFGFYSQLIFGFREGWSMGLRYEFASGSGESRVEGGPWLGDTDLFGRDRDPMRDTRVRISPLLVYAPSEFSRFRLQYNQERADHLRELKTLLLDVRSFNPAAPPIPLAITLQDKGRLAWSVFVAAEFLIGAHPAHRF